MKTESALRKKRLRYLILGIVTLLFAGVIYAWSILKMPFGDAFGWADSRLAVNFSISFCCFCQGGILAGLLRARLGFRAVGVAAAVLAAGGFIGVSRLSGQSFLALYLSYGVAGGLGIGMIYNTVLSGVNPWFPDKPGLCSGLLMTGFGSSTLLLGGILEKLMLLPDFGWRRTYLLLGVVLGLVLLACALLLRLPGEAEALPEAKSSSRNQELFELRDYTTGEMLSRSSFYRFFLYSALCSMVGNSVFSFARDYALSAGVRSALATTMVGLCSVCSGVGRMLCGVLYDALGRRKTMLAANLLTIVAPAVGLLAVVLHSPAVCCFALALLGLSYGCCPTIAAAFTGSFYGKKHYSLNFSLINSALIPASFAAPVISGMVSGTGSYAQPFLMLISAAVLALLLNLSLRRP